MANIVEDQLFQPLLGNLQKKQYVILSTVDSESGAPDVNAISWVYAKNEKTIVFAAAAKSKIVENIEHTSRAVITLIANESTYSISGEAIVKNQQIEGVSLKLSLMELHIKEVRDVMFYGSRIVVEPQYETTYDQKAADKLDQQVLEALKQA